MRKILQRYVDREVAVNIFSATVFDLATVVHVDSDIVTFRALPTSKKRHQDNRQYHWSLRYVSRCIEGGYRLPVDVIVAACFILVHEPTITVVQQPTAASGQGGGGVGGFVGISVPLDMFFG